ncbi:MAG: hypothetical protein IKR34_00395 [Candidatus Gastranaerophilales bacterium]|nr:hypothetical protein [Candidatus Gastranaerophilales bacterium]
MKKQFFILGLGFLIGTCSAFGYSSGDYYSPYASYYPYRANINQYRYYSHNPQYTLYNNTRCPYCGRGNYTTYYTQRYNPYITSVSALKQRQRLKKIKRKNKNRISLLNNKGTLTGYSVPVQNGFWNNFQNKSQTPLLNSPTCNTELWGNGNDNTGKDNNFSTNGKNYIDNSKSGAKTGVTIIYD